jgi:penicillin amidase
MATPEALNTAPGTSREKSARPKRPWLRAVSFRALLATLAALVLVLAIALAATLLWLRSATHQALPVLDGELHTPGLSAPVTVRRDAHGVPYIQAATQPDLFLAQGYITAQDRLWQMDMLRRNGAGELAEVLGPSLLPRDRMQRVFRFRAMAQRIYDTLSDDDRAPLDAYARGVNLYIDQHQNALPPEFRLLMYKPRPWTGVDSMCIYTMMIQLLDTQWNVKLGRESVAAHLNNPKLLAQLYPVGSWRDHPPTGEVVDLSQPRPAPPPSSDDDEDDDRTQAALPVPHSGANFTTGSLAAKSRDLAALRDTLGLTACTGCIPGSNNWVISGKHTASGKPLLSNDMHLPLTVPNLWYMVGLQAPGLHAAGVALPGIPFVTAGHNEHVAWGFTTLMGDVQDIYVEKLDGKGNFQAADGSWKPLSVDHQVIHVRGAKDVLVDVQSTAHGPLLNPLLPHESRPLALRWSLYDPSLTGIPSRP